ncbi:unnamed protein product, partial [Polarella glacialis]
GLHSLAVEHLNRSGVQVPEIKAVPMPASLRLQAAGEGLEVDTQILVTDNAMDISRKIKKAFCEPGNVDFCPPLSWVEALLLGEGEFVVSRKPENGGDLRYSDVSVMRKDFVEGILHPGDLKPSVGSALNTALASLQDGLKNTPALKQAQKKIDAYVKAQQKKK